jgi:hypothetical protein
MPLNINTSSLSEVLFEAGIITMVVSLLYFIVLVPMEEVVLINEMKRAIDQLGKEFQVPLAAMNAEDKEQITNDIKNSKPTETSPERVEYIKQNNIKYFNQAVISVVVYSVIMITLSVYLWKYCGYGFRKFRDNAIVPALISVVMIVSLEIFFVQYALGNFMAVDINKSIDSFLISSRFLDPIVDDVVGDLPGNQ